MIRTVIFDIDGTLYDYDTANRKAVNALQEYCASAFGWSEEEFLEAHQNAFDQLNWIGKGTSLCHNRMIRYGLIAENAGLPMHHALSMNETYWDSFLLEIAPFRGVQKTLQELHRNGLRVGIGSNMTAYEQYLKLNRLGLLDCFDFIVTSEEAKTEKPDPEFYAYCAVKAGCDVKECLFVGDNLKLDVRGPQKAGMHAMLFLRNRKDLQLDTEEGVIHFNSYRELPKLIRDGKFTVDGE